MSQTMKHISVCIIMLMFAIAEATPPGIANNPSQSTCTNGKYKYCKNLVHVCPKFCPNDCTTDCVSCKPVCTGGTTLPGDPGSDSGSPTPPTPTPPTLTSTPPITPSPPGSDTNSPPNTPLEPTPPTPTSSPPITPSPPASDPKSPPPTPLAPTSPTPTSTPPTTPSPPITDTVSSPSTKGTPTPPSSPSTPPTPLSPPKSNTKSPPPIPPTQTPPSPISTPPTSTSSPPSYTPTPPSSSPLPWYPPSTSGKKRVRCKNKKYPQCYNVEHVCPRDCPGECLVDCVSCKPVCKCDMPGAVCQDPRFIGGDGITFYFHGKKDQDFCLVSDSNIHINSHFIGKRNPNMTRDFTWVQSIGILFGTHKLFVGARKTATWDDSVDRLALAFDGEPIFLPEKQGATWRSGIAPSVSITRAGETNTVIVEVEGNFKITTKVVPITEEDSRVHNYGIAKDDCFAHLDLGFKFYSLSDRVSGVLGQTYGADYVSHVKVGEKMSVMGGERKFSSSTLFSTDCSVARFNGGASTMSLEMASLSCGSGINGEGVVCKR